MKIHDWLDVEVFQSSTDGVRGTPGLLIRVWDGPHRICHECVVSKGSDLERLLEVIATLLPLVNDLAPSEPEGTDR